MNKTQGLIECSIERAKSKKTSISIMLAAAAFLITWLFQGYSVGLISKELFFITGIIIILGVIGIGIKLYFTINKLDKLYNQKENLIKRNKNE
jgi:hypothetical protein